MLDAHLPASDDNQIIYCCVKLKLRTTASEIPPLLTRDVSLVTRFGSNDFYYYYKKSFILSSSIETPTLQSQVKPCTIGVHQRGASISPVKTRSAFG